MDIKYIVWEGVDCIHVAQNRGKCLAVVLTVINILVLWNTGISWLAEAMLASQEEFCSMDLFICWFVYLVIKSPSEISTQACIHLAHQFSLSLTSPYTHKTQDRNLLSQSADNSHQYSSQAGWGAVNHEFYSTSYMRNHRGWHGIGTRCHFVSQLQSCHQLQEIEEYGHIYIIINYTEFPPLMLKDMLLCRILP